LKLPAFKGRQHVQIIFSLGLPVPGIDVQSSNGATVTRRPMEQ
jgi:hypothetical protein